jgi:hypothetical protein
MSTISSSFNTKRVAAIGAVVAVDAFLLLLLLGSLGNSDLPPYDPPGLLWLPLLFLAGLFWALLLEVCIMLKRRRKA